MIEDNPDSRYQILKKGVEYATAQKFEKLTADTENNSNIKGVWLEEDYVRKYPYNTLASDVIGFTSDGNVGNNGIEGYYNSTLNGSDGRRYGYLDSDSTVERTVKEPTNGAVSYTHLIALLFLVRLTPLGKEVNGAKRWIRLPMNQQLQPAEIVKLAVILLIPIILCQLGNRAHKKDGIVKVIIWGFGAAAGVYFLTSNLSSAIIVAGITVCLLFVVHPKTKPFMVLAGSGLTAAIIAVAVLNRMIQDAGSSGSFRLRRVLVWLQPEQYASGSGYQTLQGLYAIGSGGFFGKGLGNSAQKMIIPEVQMCIRDRYHRQPVAS